MADVVRQDVVEVIFDIDDSPLHDILKELKQLKASIEAAFNSDAFDDMKDNADEANDSLKDIKDTAKKAKTGLEDVNKTKFSKLNNSLQSISTKLATIAKKAAALSFKALTVGITACAAAIGGLVSKSVSAYADFEQLKGGVETLFGAQGAKSVEEYAKLTGKTVDDVRDKYGSLLEAQDIVFKNANNAYRTSGLSANDYMTTVTGFSASLVSSLGGDTVKAANLADQALIDMADNANKMGTPMENIQNAYQAFAKQNYMLLDNLKLGYGGTKTEMERLVKDASKMKEGIAAGVKADDLSFGNIVKAIHAVQEHMGITGTTAKEASTTITGSLSSMKAAWGNLMPALIQGGDQFDQCLKNLIESIVGVEDETGKRVGGVINNLLPAIQKSLSGIGTLIEELSPIIEEQLPVLIDKLLPPLLKAATSLLIGLIKALPNIIKSIAKEIPNILKQLGQAIGDAFGEQFPALKKFGDFLKENADKIKKIIPAILGLVGAFLAFSKLSKVASIFGGLFGSKGGGGGSGISDIFKNLAKTDTKTVLKGMGNLAIIIGGFTIITAAIMLVAPYIAQLSDIGSFLEMAFAITVLGLVGTLLAKLGGICGKIPVQDVAKGLANMAIMLAGLSVLYLVVGAVSLIKFDIGRVLQIAVVLGVLGVIGTALSLLGALAGMMPVSTVALGLANMAIMLAGMSVLLLLIGAISLIKFNLARVLGIVVIIGVLGLVGTALSAFAMVLGAISLATGGLGVAAVALGLANMAIMIAGMAALFLLIGAVSLVDFDYRKIMQITIIIGILGTLGTALTVFASIVGMIPMPIVIAGLANIATVLGGLTAVIAAFGKLSEVKGLKELVSKGGDFLATLFGAIGKAIGSLIGGIGEGISNALPKIGDNLAKFANTLGGTNFNGISQLFNALSSVKKLPSSGGVFQFFTGDPYSGLMKMVVLLPKLAPAISSFFQEIGDNKDFSAIPSLMNALASIKELPSTGGFAQFFTGDPYIGLAVLISELPALGAAVGAFYSNLGGITDFRTLPSLFNALSSVDDLPKTGGFAQFFTGDPYIGLAALIVELPALGTAVGAFFANIGDIADFSILPKLFNALSSVDDLPKSGGFAQLFTGDPYVALAALIMELPALGTSVGAFFANIGSVEDFSLLPKLFDALASVSDLPKSGGFAQFFTGSPYAALSSMILILPTLGTAVKSFFASVSGIDDFNKINELFKALGSLDNSIEKDGGLFDAISAIFTGSEESAIVKLGTTLQVFGQQTKDFFLQVNNLNLSNLNGLWASLRNAGELTSTNLASIIDESISTLVSKISKLPQKMGDALKKNSKGLSEGLVSIWKDAVKASVAPVNKVLEAANWILKEFGSEKRVAVWTPYAKGTDGHKGGNALVNDGRGAELVQMPNGNTFIPQGRNVFIPNAPKGMKVLSAEQTARLFGRNTPTFHYADGTGDIDLWSYIDNAKGLVSKIAQGISYGGASGLSLSVGKGMVSTITGEMSTWVEKVFDELGALSLSDYVASKGVSQWRTTVIRALKMEGQYSAANVARTLYQMQTESGGNPRAINLWDSNAKKGTPSKGLMQVIDPTFKAYARSGFNRNIYDPLSNILASVRYAVSRYGTLAKAYRGVGYENGGLVTKAGWIGEYNKPEMVIPLSKDKRDRGISLWEKTGQMLGLASYSPEQDSRYYNSESAEYNTYAPQFNLTISGTNDDRSTARKVKQWIDEALDDKFTTLAHKKRRVREV